MQRKEINKNMMKTVLNQFLPEVFFVNYFQFIVCRQKKGVGEQSA
jgi:hypothetical protein